MKKKGKLSELYVLTHINEKGCEMESEIYCGLSEILNENTPHWHNHYELEITLHGGGTEYINSIAYPMRRGEAHIIYPADTHTFRTEKGLKFCFIQFERKHISDEMYKRLENGKSDPVVYLSYEACSVIENIYSAMHTVNEKFGFNDPISVYIKKKMLDAALTVFFEHSEKKAEHSTNISTELPIQKIICYIVDNYQSPISTESVAKQFNYNVAYFRCYFKNYMGINPKDYINSLRLKHAAKMLITTELKVADICFNSGYTSMASFQRNFKARYGMTPLDFRAKYSN